MQDSSQSWINLGALIGRTARMKSLRIMYVFKVRSLECHLVSKDLSKVIMRKREKVLHCNEKNLGAMLSLLLRYVAMSFIPKIQLTTNRPFSTASLSTSETPWQKHRIATLGSFSDVPASINTSLPTFPFDFSYAVMISSCALPDLPISIVLKTNLEMILIWMLDWLSETSFLRQEI